MIMKTISNKELLRWIDQNVERTRRNAMHAHMRGDSTAFENINKELAYWMEMASIVEERGEKEEDNSDDNADV